MSAGRATVLIFTVLLASACGTFSRARAERAQTQLTCGLSVAEVERIVGGRLGALEARDPRLTHLFRDGYTDLTFIFDARGLRSSQLVQVVGLTGTEAAPRVEHCEG
jgi:hypothetical protein